ncbi:peptide chain release factor N(5)-glutamine methyltransferase [Telmatobacter sp. DSM 110680]|uniref:Release factor glutamine methyltransferase n=1 Tax=Telmatobacter sp. DSM 110680 TaxID=3036704 RepID=A0AAU7DQ19_9BACT
MTLRDWLVQSEAQLLDGPHPDRAKRDAETLLLYLIGKNKAWLMAHAEDDFAGCTAIRYAGLLERRRKGEPIQYIIGETEFYGMPFRVTPDVLIPRPETEHLVEKCVALATQKDARILDVGTGSGAISIALAVHLPHAYLTAVDISEAALSIARDNAKLNHVADRIRFLNGDLLTPVSDEQFDIIVSNPPYVPNTDRALISVEVREHEPAVALFGGDDGLAIFRRLIPAAYAAVAPGGYLAFEFGFSQMSDVEFLLKSAGFQKIEFTHDLQGIPRIASAQKI